MRRRKFIGLTLGGALLPALHLVHSSAFAAQSGGTLRIASTLADIPFTMGQASGGFEGVRFVSYALYDGLTRYDLSREDKAPKLLPSLAESWEGDAQDKTRWVFKLRRNVKFHDGSDFNADAVIWNLDKLLNNKSPQFDRQQATVAAGNTASIASYRKIDDFTVEIKTKTPDFVLPYYMAQIFMSSPARWESIGRDWTKFATNPAGTGPFIMTALVPRTRVEMTRNDAYWDAARRPKVQNLAIFAMPDASTRTAALLSGQVDWVEAPAPDTIARLRGAKMNITSNVYPHVWPWVLSHAEGSPFRDLRVRKAANLAVDRDALVTFLGGLALPAKGMVDPKHPWFGKPTFDIKFDPEQARRLMTEAGYSAQKPCRVKIVASPGGSGQMQPMPMNEFIQENLRAAFFDVQFDVMDWEALRARRRAMASGAENKGVAAINQSWTYHEAHYGLLSITEPGGFNWSEWADPKAVQMAAEARAEFDPARQAELLQKLHAYMVDQAIWLWVVHDMNPRALSPKVQGYVQAQSWFVDLNAPSIR